MARGVLIALLSALVPSGNLAYGSQLAAQSAESMEVSPVKRVTELLGKMKSELESEAANEAEMYDKMVCWCETSEKEKTEAVALAESKDKELSAEIEGRAARFGELATEIQSLKDQIAKDTEAVKTASAIRDGEASEFSKEEKDLVQAIDNLRNAIAILSKHHGNSLVQLEPDVLSSIRAILRDSAVKYEMLMGEELPTQHLEPGAISLLSVDRTVHKSDLQASRVSKALLSALDTRGEAVDSLPLKFAEQVIARSAKSSSERSVGGAFLQATAQQPLFSSYSSQSSEIFGVLQQMLEEFEGKLSSSQKDELQSKESAKELAESKEKQLIAGKKKLDMFEEEHATNEKAISDAKEDLELTRKQRSADIEFLSNLKLQCNDLDSEWEKRSKTRAEELKAVAETITILTEDDNREHLAKTSSFLQLASKMGSRSRSRAASLLRAAAQAPAFDADDLLDAWRSHSGKRHSQTRGPRAQLSALAVTVQLDAFPKVKEAMTKMVAELKKQQEEEVQFKAYCGKELQENEKATQLKTQEKGDLENKIDEIDALVKKLNEEMENAKKQIADTQLEIKKAGENREKENKEFQTLVADQRQAQEILKKALTRLEAFYKRKGAGSFVQRSGQTPPVQFNKYKENSGSSPVMGLIEQVINDSVQLEKEATAGEYKAQADYEVFVKDSTVLVADLSASVTSKTKAVGNAKGEGAEAKSELESALGELESLSEFVADLHGQCDWVLKNFDIRQKGRLQEMEAIQQAMGILAGAGSKEAPVQAEAPAETEAPESEASAPAPAE